MVEILKKTKKPKTITADFSQSSSKKAKITISLFMKNFKNKNIILVLVFGFIYLVSVYPTERSKHHQNLHCALGKQITYYPKEQRFFVGRFLFSMFSNLTESGQGDVFR